jgi:hypothetical protein
MTAFQSGMVTGFACAGAIDFMLTVSGGTPGTKAVCGAGHLLAAAVLYAYYSLTKDDAEGAK